MGIRDFLDSFGAVHITENDGELTIAGLDVMKFLVDVKQIWGGGKLCLLMFKAEKGRKYRLVFDQFYALDVLYQLEQILLFKKRKSNKHRIKQAIALLRTDTWLKSTTEAHPDILDFTQLSRLKFKLLPTQLETLQQYNSKVPKMQLKGFLLGTPPGCLTGDTEIVFTRDGEAAFVTLAEAYDRFNQNAGADNWDLSVPTYVRSYTGTAIELHPLYSIVYSGIQEVYRVTLENGSFLDCTFMHPLLTATGFIPARDALGTSVMIDATTTVKGCRYKQANPRVAEYSTVVSVEYRGDAPTYDIICREPHHNFAANDMIVHNSGKTLMSIALGICLHADVTIFVVPKNTVTTVWYDGIIEQFGPDTKIWSSVRDEPLTPDYDYYIFHYEALEKAIALAKALRGIKTKPFIAIDESHNLNEITSQRTLRLIEIAKILDCQHTVFATGTPVKALGLEMVPLLRTIDRFFTPEAEWRFMKIYGKTAKRANDILRNRLGLISHKIVESDYMKIEPPKEIDYPVVIPHSERFLIKNIKIEMTKFMEDRYQFYRKNMGAYARTYNEGIAFYEKTLRTPAQRQEFATYRTYFEKLRANYDPIADGQIAKFTKEIETKKIIPILPQPLKNQFKDALSVYKWVKLRVMGEFLGQLSRIRAECAIEIAKHARLDEIVLDADKKTIIFSSFIPALMVAEKYLTEHSFKTLSVYGDQTKNIAAIVNQFKHDPDCNPLLGTLQSLAASQTLTVANTVVFLDAPFREYIRNQAFHRVFRIGQDTQTYIYMCSMKSAEPNISTRSADILDWSKQQVEAIFGSTSREEALGIIKRLHLNPPSGMELLLDMMKKVNPF